MNVPIAQLRPGQYLTNRLLLSADRIKHWKFAGECAAVGGGIMPGSRLKIAEVHARPGDDWVKLVVPGGVLKVAGGELAHLFETAR